MTVKNELIRKSIHLFMVIIPLSLLFLEKWLVLGVLGGIILLAMTVEILRLRWPGFYRVFEKIFGPLLREHERGHLTGSTYLLMGAFLAILLFDKTIALTVLLFVVVSDGLGALTGRMWGRHNLTKDKTLEGCAVFLLTAGAIVLLTMQDQILIGMMGVVVAFVIDVFVTGLNDNLAIPLGAGAVMHALIKL
jgi:diacylglycerol kinase (CTP)